MGLIHIDCADGPIWHSYPDTGATMPKRPNMKTLQMQDTIDRLVNQRDETIARIDELADLMADSTELLVKNTPVVARLNAIAALLGDKAPK